MGHPICMRVVITEATGNFGSVVVQRLHAEGTHDLADLARRLPEGPDSRGADRRSVDLSTDACHDALGALGDTVHRGAFVVRRLP
ncbi:hypothetical protein O7599_04875 [Streptomyces sp. WMMC500]|uniref:hypothetical protein n=1 Tax=Streptomyces sp. WMMC500 TaxID=3015154 RepID=UPI00248BA98B|nr:hypothetical protein [Streptomyces sp. WMMC500]WBB61888.1 hypothetical protein O7599_04875 [Streptomyces sp. WMMC500]